MSCWLKIIEITLDSQECGWGVGYPLFCYLLPLGEYLHFETLWNPLKNPNYAPALFFCVAFVFFFLKSLLQGFFLVTVISYTIKAVLIVQYCYPEGYQEPRELKWLQSLDFNYIMLANGSMLYPSVVNFLFSTQVGWPCELSNSAQIANFAV